MPQTFVEPKNISGNRFSVTGPEAHHLARVLRCQVEDAIQLFDGTGKQYRGILTKINLEEPAVEGRIVEVLPTDHQQHYIRLFQGLPKGAKFDFIVEKTVELGVDEILPFMSQKSPVKLTPLQAEKKGERWSRLIKAAAKQSNRKTIPKITEPAALFALGDQVNKGFTILFSEGTKSVSLRDLLKTESNSALSMAARINIIVGPESGFSEKEVAWLVGLGAQQASLGNLTLRTETAGLAALSILNYELRRM